MYRASPPRRVPELSPVGDASVAAAQAAPTDADDFVNLYASHMTHEAGFAHGVYAVLPDKPDYDKIRFAFGAPAMTAVTGATLAIWARLADGSVMLLGTSDLSAEGTFPSVEIENFQATYAVTVQGIDTTGTGLDGLNVFVQGIHEEN